MDKIQVGDAVKAIEQRFREQTQWMIKAQTLLKLVAEPSVDRAVIAEQCKAHAEAMNEI